jgi:glycogen operon protein
MLRAGDELGHTQGGNNNAYCQDNEISWLDWRLQPPAAELLAFARQLAALRQRHPVFRRRRYLSGEFDEQNGRRDIHWLRPDGAEMDESDWDGNHRCVAVRLDGGVLAELDERGRPALASTVVLFFNAHHEEVAFRLPPASPGSAWTLVVDTAGADQRFESRTCPGGSEHRMPGRSVAMFELVEPGSGVLARLWRRFRDRRRRAPQLGAGAAS